jgi:hypothetical protein
MKIKEPLESIVFFLDQIQCAVAENRGILSDQVSQLDRIEARIDKLEDRLDAAFYRGSWDTDGNPVPFIESEMICSRLP